MIQKLIIYNGEIKNKSIIINKWFPKQYEIEVKIYYDINDILFQLYSDILSVRFKYTIPKYTFEFHFNRKYKNVLEKIYYELMKNKYFLDNIIKKYERKEKIKEIYEL